MQADNGKLRSSREDKIMTCDYLSRLLTLYTVLCAIPRDSIVQGARNFEKKVSILMNEEPETLKCFAEGRTDFTCFWEDDEKSAGSVEQYDFTYTYHRDENSSKCPLRVLQAAGRKRLYVCHLNQPQMFVKMDIKVYREEKLIHNRSVLIDLLFLLDPPANVTVSRSQQGQLNVSWVLPSLKYMDDSMIYEVSYTMADSHVWQVEVAHASSELILRGLQPATRYKVRVRVKFDGIAYNGYWSAWSDPVFMETLPAELNPLIVSLTLIFSFILMVLSLTVLMSHRRFLTKKIWPTIPTPDSKFQGLFTDYGGDFEAWLGQTNGGLWLSPPLFYSVECPSSLEVLSELSLSLPVASPPLPHKTSRVLTRSKDVEKELDEREMMTRGDSAVTKQWNAIPPHDHWLMDRLRELHSPPVPCCKSSQLESQDAYVTLSENNHSEDKHLEDTFEEALPLEMLFTSRKTQLSESHSDLGSVQQSSGSGHLSSQSSFEYPDHGWIPKGPGYTYMAVADSGVSMDYSPMSRADDIGKVAIYANEIHAHSRPFLPKQKPVQDDC